jgi:hypothetical protein
MARPMETIRDLLRAHRRLAMLLVVLALAIKASIPTGYMPVAQGRVMTVAICADASGNAATRQIVLPADGKAGAHDQGAHDKSAGDCPFAALAMAGLTGADAVLLTLALAFILALGFAPVAPARALRTSFLRPPLRGPPARA